MTTETTTSQTTEQTVSQTTGRGIVRGEPRAMLALITLADLPVPTGVRFYVYPDGSGILSLDLATVADGQAWSRHLGGSTETYLNTDGRTYLREGAIEWHGWSVHLHASEFGPTEPNVTGDDNSRLLAIAAAGIPTDTTT